MSNRGRPAPGSGVGPETLVTSPAHTRRISVSVSSKSFPWPFAGAPLAAKSSGQPPRPSPAVSRPPESRSTVASCLANRTGLLRQPTFSTLVNNWTRSVTAAATPRQTSGSRTS
jgi:hypothetical protein